MAAAPKSTLAGQRCFNHHQREAAARCPGCGRFFCRECITEHDDRVLCAGCLKKVERTPFLRRGSLGGAMLFGQALLGLFLAWFFFYLVGEVLLAIPSSFHEGTLWLGQ